MRSNYKKLGDFIRPVKEKNKDLKYAELLGINIDKFFMPSVANVVGTNMANYKIVRPGQFACNRMHVGRDYRIPVALSKKDKPFIVSPAYDVFEITKPDELDAEYLMMWFSRKEFDRNAWFHTDADVRGGLPWSAFCNLELPIPAISTQREIVAEYNTVINRIKLNEQLNQKLEETAQAVYRRWFVEFEFPNEEGEPYKSSGGKMVWNEELGKEVPEGWEVKHLKDISSIKGGKRLPRGEILISNPTQHPYIKVADMGSGKYIRLNNRFEFVSEDVQHKISRYTVSEDDLIISIVGTIGIAKLIDRSLAKANLTENCVKITQLRDVSSSYLYHYFMSSEGKEEIVIRNVGAVQAKLPIYNIETFPILIGLSDLMIQFQSVISKVDDRIKQIDEEQVKLENMRIIILSRMTNVETEKESAVV